MSVEHVNKFKNRNVQFKTKEEIQEDGTCKHLQIFEKEGRNEGPFRG
jgi:hypothetical protein